MFRILLLLSVASACDIITTLPCNGNIKTCYIHPNVCNAIGIVFQGFGSGWTFVFVLTTVTAAQSCTQSTAGLLSQQCVSPVTNPAAMNASFMLQTTAGFADSDATFIVMPANPLLIATIVLPASLAGSTLYVLRIRGSTFTSINVAFSSQNPMYGGLLYLGGGGVLTITNAQFTNTSVSIVVQTPNVQVKFTGCGPGTAMLSNRAIGPVIVGALNSSNISVGTASQWVLLDYTTPPFSLSGSITIFNVSVIVPFALTLPSETTCTSMALPSASKSMLTTAMEIGISTLAALVIIILIRRHYKHARAL